MKLAAKRKTAAVAPKARGEKTGVGKLGKRRKIVEEFANYVDYEKREIVPEARRRILSSSDVDPVRMNVVDATLAGLVHDWRVKDAVAKTGHTFQEILTNCQLLLDGQPDYPDTWTIRWPCGFIAPDNGHLVRAALLLVWAFNDDDPRDENLQRRHERAVDWMAHYVAGVRLTAEHRRRQAGGHGAAASDKRTANRKAVVRQWMSLSNRPTHERAAIIADRLGITARHVRRLLRKSGLRRARPSKVRE